ncbi:MAG: bifunctional molybdenum cofactor biosynthesis protein MoaC/MoaB [Nevskiales bacterium]|nr:bifunctional molybdenum cofactor biosynthesis protein MoaC/MoaB [Nevskiales bacterium]
MRDITLKPSTLRSARATGFVSLPPDTVALVRARGVTKGDVAEAARLSGLMAIKRTPDLLPHCHPLAVLDADLDVNTEDGGIRIEARVRTIASTGVEMEALTAVSVAALTVYDMLKPHAPPEALAIGEIRLLEKRGGKTQYRRQLQGMRAAVIVLSDSVASGRKPDTAGASVRDALADAGFEIAGYEVLADDADALRDCLQGYLDAGTECVITVGGTGLGPRDLTVDTVAPMLTTPLPGFMEAARNFGQQRTPFAMLSRGVAGMIGSSFVATFPGSRRGAEETLAAVLPGLVHLLEVSRSLRPHEGGYA